MIDLLKRRILPELAYNATLPQTYLFLLSAHHLQPTAKIKDRENGVVLYVIMVRVLYIKCPDDELKDLYISNTSHIKPSVARAERTDSSEHWVYSPRDTGIDLFTPIANVVPASVTIKVDLGIAVAAYEETETYPNDVQQVTSSTSKPIALFLIVRSSTGTKTPLRQANAPGLIDQGYRGNLMAAVDNIHTVSFTAEMHSRLFQLMCCDGVPFDEVRFVDNLDATDRGIGGFGSTGQ